MMSNGSLRTRVILAEDKSSRISNLLKYHLEFGKWILVVPFEFEIKGVAAEYTGRLRRAAIVFLLLFHVVITSLDVWEFSDDVYQHYVQNLDFVPGFLINFVKIPEIIYNPMFLLNLWTCSSLYARVLNRIRRLTDKFDQAGIQLPSKCSVGLIAGGTMTYVSLFSVIEFLCYKLKLVQVSFLEAFQMEDEWNHNFFGSALSWNGTVSAGSCLTVTVTAFLRHYELIVTRYADSVCFTIAITLYLLTKSLIRHLKKQPLGSLTEQQITDYLNDLLELSDTIEDTAGNVVFLCSFTFLPYFAFMIKDIYESSPGARIQFCMSVISFIALMWAAAEAHVKMNSLLRYLRQVKAIPSSDFGARGGNTNNYESNNQIGLILHQISKDGLGMKGRAFTITYGFFGNLAGLIITYAVIVFQSYKGGLADSCSRG